MKASVAAEIADQRDYSELVMQDLLQDIERAASQGRYEMRYSNDDPARCIAPETRVKVKDKLTALGYFVHFDEVTFIISWRGAK